MNNLTPEWQAYFEGVVTRMENDLIAATDKPQMGDEQRKEIQEAVREGAVNTLKWFSSSTGNAPTAHDKWAMHFTSNRENKTSLYQIGERFENLRPLTKRLLDIYHASSQSYARSGALVTGY
jgi:hypothetical protein